MRSLLTVSELALRGGEAERALRRWIAETEAFNAALDLTGGTVVARNLIADIVEGEPGAIERSLRRSREAHHQIHLTVVDAVSVRARAFGDWALLYQGCATYVAAPIAALLDVQDAFHANRLRSLMRAFGEPGAAAPPTAATILRTRRGDGASGALVEAKGGAPRGDPRGPRAGR